MEPLFKAIDCYQCNEEICCMALNIFLTSIYLETPGPLYPKICN